MSHIITERLCLTEDGKLVPEGDPRGRWFYAAPGREIPDEEAAKYGLTSPAPAASTATVDAAALEEPPPAKPAAEPAAPAPKPKAPKPKADKPKT